MVGIKHLKLYLPFYNEETSIQGISEDMISNDKVYFKLYRWNLWKETSLFIKGILSDYRWHIFFENSKIILILWCDSNIM